MILNNASNVMLGSIPVNRIYKGNTIVWERISAAFKLKTSDYIIGTPSIDDEGYFTDGENFIVEVFNSGVLEDEVYAVGNAIHLGTKARIRRHTATALNMLFTNWTARLKFSGFALSGNTALNPVFGCIPESGYESQFMFMTYSTVNKLTFIFTGATGENDFSIVNSTIAEKKKINSKWYVYFKGMTESALASGSHTLAMGRRAGTFFCALDGDIAATTTAANAFGSTELAIVAGARRWSSGYASPEMNISEMAVYPSLYIN